MHLALVNQKGGVGKSTTAVNLAAGIAEVGHRVLLVDLDSQAHASLYVGFSDEEHPSTADVLLDRLPIQEAIRKTSVERLDLIPSSSGIGEFDMEMAHAEDRTQRLRDAVAPIRDLYDFVVYDSPPSVSLLMVNIMVAADAFIVPTHADWLSLKGMLKLFQTAENAREAYGTAATLLGVLLTRVDYRERVTSELVEQLRSAYPTIVFQTEIRTSVRLKESPSFGQTIFQYAPNSVGARTYRELTQEVLQRAREKGFLR